jgi:hypothetical protein
MEQEATDTSSTRALLNCGVLAGPVYVLVAVIEVLIRPGFDLTRHALSLLSNGQLGWIQIANFFVTGSLTLAGAAGLRRAMRGTRGGAWGPLLLGIYGVGLIGAAFFRADPMNGFPPGTPDGPPVNPSLHSTLHIVAGTFGFIGFIAACFVFARRFAALGERTWSIYSAATGVIFFAGFFGIATGSQQMGGMLTFVTLAFTAAVVLGWTWISMLCARTRRHPLPS